LKGLYTNVLTAFTSFYEMLQNIEQFIFKSINTLAKENPA